MTRFLIGSDVLWTLLLCISTADGITCVKYAVDPCMMYVRGDADGSAFYRPYNSTELQNFCSVYDQFDACVSPFVADCTAEYRWGIRGIQRAANYICKQEFKSRADNYDCYKMDVIQKGSKQCVDRYKARENILLHDISRATNQDQVDDVFKHLCDDINTRLSCVKSTFASYCDDDVTRIQHTAEKLLIQEMTDDLQCEVSAAVHNLGHITSLLWVIIYSLKYILWDL